MTSEINLLRDRLDSIDKKIEKVSTHTLKIDTKLIKFISALEDKEGNLQITKLKKIDPNENFLRTQLELNVGEKIEREFDSLSETNSISWDTLLKALNFPNDKNDILGYAALNEAKKNNNVLRCLQVSEDFLNLLAQDGLYLDDVKIEPPSVQAWINFIKLDKDQNTRRLSCIGVEQYFDTLRSRMKSDPVFRDTALMLVRRFDKLLKCHLFSADDHQIFDIAKTRSGKAFLIVGCISNIF